MHKIISIIILSGLTLFAADSAKYEVSFSIFGKIGEVQMERQFHNNSYLISLAAQTTGTAASLSNNRAERYLSQGEVIDGVMQPDVFVKERKSNDKTRYKIYRFDHENKTVFYQTITEEKVTERSFDVMKMQFSKDEKTVFSHSEALYDYYAKDDIVSLYFNSGNYLAKMQEGESRELHAVGINGDKRKNGAVLITKLEAKESNKSFSITIDEEIFQEGGGTLYVRQDADVFPHTAEMRNIMIFGNVEGKRIYETVSLR